MKTFPFNFIPFPWWVIFGFLLSFHYSSWSQTWVKIDMAFPPNDTLLSYSTITFATKNIGWIVSSGSIDNLLGKFVTKVFNTTNGGYSWQLQKKLGEFFSDFILFTVDSLRCWALSPAGGIRFTTNGGAAWDSSLIQVGDSFGTLLFFNAQDGMAFNQYVWYTSDGGWTWLRGDTTGIRFTCPTDVSFPDEKIGWIVGACNPRGVTHSGFIAKTTEGGKTWKYQADALGIAIPWLSGVDFVDTLSGFAAGNNSRYSSGYIFSTADGGKKWNWKQIIGSGGFYDVGFFDKNLGWITGDAGKIWRTTDSGKTWALQSSGANARLRKIGILRNEKVAYIFGDNYYGPPYTLLWADLSTVVDVTEQVVEMPGKFSLLQNYPNPFNSQTIIESLLSGLEYQAELR